MAAARFNKKDSKLIEDLMALSKKSPKLVKSSVYDAPADPTIQVRSWKMNEFKYYDIPSPFPTLARGLFSTELPDGGHRIVVRGYDKFFNIGEVPWTTWPSIEAHTAAPYTLSLKSNGCIIFIAALTESKLIITSKHSLGSLQGSEQSHAQVGEKWLRKYLEQKERTEEQLARVLWDNNWTAIAELCDDNFEEHVLAYPPEKTGLHLHGLNVSTKTFTTLPQPQVDAFAEEWGFIKTKSIVLDTIAEVQKFTQEVADLGEWEGEAVEGFVVRTHVTEPPTETKRGTQVNVSASPYDPGTSFFFKVKFDEPYMMYRDWREVTKKIISCGISKPTSDKLPKQKLKRPETKVYVRWVIDEIKRDREAFENYTKGKGVIATRERFLEYLQTPQGKAELETIKTGHNVAVAERDKTPGKTIIVPVAIPGCGKTTVAVALAHIFGFGHTQSDDVKQKKAAPVFIKNVTDLLDKFDVVIADKNNHLRQHRQALRQIQHGHHTIQLIALNWSIHGNQSAIHRICGDRIFGRGENHQTLRADEAKSHEDVVWKFLNDYEDLDDSEVDEIIEMNLEDDIETAVNHAINQLVETLALPQPSPERIQEGLERAMNYKVKVDAKKAEASQTKKKEKEFKPRYFGLLPEIDIKEVVVKHLAHAKGVPQSCRHFWKAVEDDDHRRHHITIVHAASLSAEIELWDRCMELHKTVNPPLFSFKLDYLVWNDRVMALTVCDLAVDTPDEEQKGAEFVSKLPSEVRERLHITVGTRHGGKPVEAKDMIEQWRKSGDQDGVQSIEMDGVLVKGVLKGLSN